MPQCKAETANGTQCVSEIVAPSRSLCRRHQNMLASGKTVINFESGRKFPAPAAPAPKAAARRATATAPRATASSSSSSRASATGPRRAAAPARATAPRAASRTATPVVEEEPREPRSPGEHPLMCDASGCRNMALPGSDYCMKHQILA